MTDPVRSFNRKVFFAPTGFEPVLSALMAGVLGRGMDALGLLVALQFLALRAQARA